MTKIKMEFVISESILTGKKFITFVDENYYCDIEEIKT